GLGNRELAGEITREWYERYKAEREALAREAQLSLLADEAEDAASGGRSAPKAAEPAVKAAAGGGDRA
ncbi:MAG: hypothetical protein HY275_01685, partial [Gemmatimonadetes bacterium]|nr:hypothetical protein [Gemmatimonadota bacterium]